MLKDIFYHKGRAAGKKAFVFDEYNKIIILQFKGVKLYISAQTMNVLKEEIINKAGELK